MDWESNYQKKESVGIYNQKAVCGGVVHEKLIKRNIRS